MKRLLLILSVLTSLQVHAQLIINELMQSNIDCLLDGTNNFPDSWVELYNPTDQSIDLGQYRLGVTNNYWEAYQLPSKTVAAHGYTVVLCDKANTGRHTHFRLESGNGGAVYLFLNQQLVAQLTNIPKQLAPNIAYGRRVDGSDEWGWLRSPTPDASNCGQLDAVLLGNPVFSVPGQVITGGNSLSLSLSVPAGAPEGTVIRYTTDGSEPTATSPLYESSFVINRTLLVRAKLFCEGYQSPRSVTQSYIVFPREMPFAVVSIVSDERYFSDGALGILVAGNTGENFKKDWRRPINFELFTSSNSASVLNQLCETRVMGNASRGNPLKSLAIYAHKRFGKKRLQYEFFPEQRPGHTDYKSIILRNAGNDFDYLYMRDAIMQSVFLKYGDIDGQAYRPAVVFINGEYKGMLNLRERSNEDNIYTNYNGLEDIVFVEGWWTVKSGEWNDWNSFKQFYQTTHSWEEWNQVLDCREFIDIMMLNIFFNNQDFPGNNINFWRPRVASNGLPARWRVISKDTDFGLGLYDNPATYNTIRWLYTPGIDSNHDWGNAAEYTLLFRNAMQDSTFFDEFIDRSMIYMGDFLRYDRIWEEIWEPMYEQIKTEYPIHRRLFNQWWPNYDSELSKAKAWLQARPTHYISQLRGYYGLGIPVTMTINKELGEEKSDIQLYFNGVPLQHDTWEGKFFASRPIRLKAEWHGDPGYTINMWYLTYKTSSSTSPQTLYFHGDSLEWTPPYNCVEVMINAIKGEYTDMDNLSAEQIRIEKRIENGHVVIIRDGKRYNVLGGRVE